VTDVKTLMTGIGLGESPRWHDGRLWFCDWVAQEIIACAPDGTNEVVANVSSFPFSIDWQPDGQLLVIAGSDRRLLRATPDGSLTTYVELASACDKPWNEIVVDGRGNTYLNNIGFDMMAGEEATTGMIALVTRDGVVRSVGDGLAFPNGMAITPDNATLIVAESHGKKLTAFDVASDGTLSAQRLWADLGDGAPDGICIDAEGAVWYADVPNRRCVRVCEGGEVLQTIDVDRGCFACMLGGADGMTLFITAADWRGPASIGEERSGQLFSAPVSVPHAGWP